MNPQRVKEVATALVVAHRITPNREAIQKLNSFTWVSLTKGRALGDFDITIRVLDFIGEPKEKLRFKFSRSLVSAELRIHPVSNAEHAILKQMPKVIEKLKHAVAILYLDRLDARGRAEQAGWYSKVKKVMIEREDSVNAKDHFGLTLDWCRWMLAELNGELYEFKTEPIRRDQTASEIVSRLPFKI